MGLLDSFNKYNMEIKPETRMGLLAAGASMLRNQDRGLSESMGYAFPAYAQGRQLGVEQIKAQQEEARKKQLIQQMLAGGQFTPQQAAMAEMAAQKGDMGTLYNMSKGQETKFGTRPSTGINPATGKPGQFVTNQATGEVKWLGTGVYDKPADPKAPSWKRDDVSGEWYDQNAATRPNLAVPANRPLDPERIKLEKDQRKEYTAIVKPYREVADNHKKLIKALTMTGETGVGSLAATYQFMKSLDPGSVVREGEFAQAEKAAGIKARFMNLWDKTNNGTFLPPEVKAEMARLSSEMVDVARQSAEQTNESYGKMADEYGMPRHRVMPGYDWNNMPAYSTGGTNDLPPE